jgi:Flagellar hook-length control protein
MHSIFDLLTIGDSAISQISRPRAQSPSSANRDNGKDDTFRTTFAHEARRKAEQSETAVQPNDAPNRGATAASDTSPHQRVSGATQAASNRDRKSVTESSSVSENVSSTTELSSTMEQSGTADNTPEFSGLAAGTALEPQEQPYHFTPTELSALLASFEHDTVGVNNRLLGGPIASGVLSMESIVLPVEGLKTALQATVQLSAGIGESPLHRLRAAPGLSIQAEGLSVQPMTFAELRLALNGGIGLSANLVRSQEVTPTALPAELQFHGVKSAPVAVKNEGALLSSDWATSMDNRMASFEGMLNRSAQSEALFRLGIGENVEKLSALESGPALETSVRHASVAGAGLNLNTVTHDSLSSRLQMPVNVTFGRPQWAGMVAERAAMMAGQNIQSAELQLDPPELGPLQVRVQVNSDQVVVSFVSGHANVRDALDTTATRLRELCEQQGLNLVDVDVSDQSPDEEPTPQPEHSASGQTETVLDAPQDEQTTTLSVTVQTGIDYFA